MGEYPHKPGLRFRAKVLIPVVAVLVILLGVALWEFSIGMEKQMRYDAAIQGTTFHQLFTNSLAFRTNEMEHELESRVYSANFGFILDAWDHPEERESPGFFERIGLTAQDLLPGMLTNLNGADVLLFVSRTNGLLSGVSRNATLNTTQFHIAAAKVIEEALSSDEYSAKTIAINGCLVDVMVLPCHSKSELAGALCVGVELGNAFAEAARIPKTEVAFFVDGRVAASTFTNAALDGQLLDTYHHLGAEADFIDPIQGEHFLGLTGSFPRFAGSEKAGYLLLTSCEEPLKELHSRLKELLFGSLIGIVASVALVWLVVRRATRPLHALRDTAEAVGLGDFSKRVETNTADEFGELGFVFNHMTENLQKSRAELEETVKMLRNTRAQLVHSEKLSAVGEFVAGVAHELNNPLTALIGYSELLQMDSANDGARDSLKRISSSAERCHKIVQSLLAFARQHPPERKPTNIHNIIDSVLEILIYELRTSNISVTREYASNLPKLMIDPHQVQQVFLNIVHNARQAIEANQPKGSILISTSLSGNQVQVRFKDDGPGISAENLAKIFNPFFTTKPVGKGTGLGLSLSYGIIQEHGGQIHAESQVGRGTTFIIDLPVTEGVEVAPKETTAAPAPSARAGIGRKVLIVDDEADILDLLCKTLQHQGYSVQSAVDGEMALRCLSGQSFDLIVSDWKMPGMNGQQLHERLLQTNRMAASRMIFMTGDVLSEKVEAYLNQHGKTCLAKPFSLVEFQGAVGKIFDNRINS